MKRDAPAPVTTVPHVGKVVLTPTTNKPNMIKPSSSVTLLKQQASLKSASGLTSTKQKDWPQAPTPRAIRQNSGPCTSGMVLPGRTLHCPGNSIVKASFKKALRNSNGHWPGQLLGWQEVLAEQRLSNQHCLMRIHLPNYDSSTGHQRSSNRSLSAAQYVEPGDTATSIRKGLSALSFHSSEMEFKDCIR